MKRRKGEWCNASQPVGRCVKWFCVLIVKNNTIFASMQKHNHIKALFFLGIFSMLLLHQVLPHWHHEHDVAHNENHSHDHNVPEKESPNKGFLDLFLEMHVNITVSSEILLTHTSSVKQLIVKTYKSAPASVNYYTVFINYDEVDNIRVYQPPNNYFNSYLSSLDSRGPPSLG